MALPREARLRRARDVRRVLDGGQVLRGAEVIVYWLRRGDDGAGPRATVIASRRVGGAVVRNRVRRRVAEALRRRLRGGEDVDLVVIARRRAAGARGLGAAVGRLLAGAGLHGVRAPARREEEG